MDAFKTSVNAFADAANVLNDELNASRLKLSAVQAELNNILHVFEYLDIDASTASRLTKKMKELYKIRREYKEKNIICQNILDHHKNPSQEIVSSMERVLRYKNEAMNSLTKFLDEV